MAETERKDGAVVDRAKAAAAALKERCGRVRGYLGDGVWEEDVESCGTLRRMRINALRFLGVLSKGFVEHRIGLHAAGLTFISLLSVVPILMLMLLLTKPCGMYGWARNELKVQTDKMIERFFEHKMDGDSVVEKGIAAVAAGAKLPVAQQDDEAGRKFGAQARELRDQVLGQVDDKIEHFNFGLMALVGFAVLAFTVTSTFGQVETTMNEIWRVKKGRSLWKRLLLYGLTLMVLPFLAALAMSLPLMRMVKSVLDATLGATSYTKWAGDALVAVLDSSFTSFAVSLLFTTLAFAFLFWVMPNRDVKWRPAFWGGLLTALILKVWMAICVVLQGLIGKSSAAYGSFALIPILIIWISYNWKIILIGSNMAYAFQCVDSKRRDLLDE